jgi:Domain of unknown function (DUF397)
MSDDKFSGWRKSSYSGDGNSCVELAATGLAGYPAGLGHHARPDYHAGPGSHHPERPLIGVRDSQANDCSPVLEFSFSAWQEFLNRIKLG